MHASTRTSTSLDSVQGRLLGMPYDFRRPTRARIAARMWNPGGPLLSPKAWGWGWTLNLAHPGSKWVLGGLAAMITLALVLGFAW